MPAMTLTGKGQFTFNKPLLEHLGVKAGDKVVVKKLPDGSLKIKAEKNTVPLDALFGSITSPINPSDDELQAAIAQSYVQRGMSE